MNGQALRPALRHTLMWVQVFVTGHPAVTARRTTASRRTTATLTKSTPRPPPGPRYAVSCWCCDNIRRHCAVCSVIRMQHELTWLVFPRCVGQSGSQGGDRQGSRGSGSACRQGSGCAVGGGGGEAQGSARQAQARRCYTAPAWTPGIARCLQGICPSHCIAV